MIGKRETNLPYIQTPSSVISITKEEKQEDTVWIEGNEANNLVMVYIYVMKFQESFPLQHWSF